MINPGLNSGFSHGLVVATIRRIKLLL